MLAEIRDYLVAFKEQCEAEIEVGENSLNDALASVSIARLSKLIEAIDSGQIAEATNSNQWTPVKPSGLKDTLRSND